MTAAIQSVDWAVVAPPVIAAATALAVLVTDLFLPAARKRLLGPLAAAGLLLAALALLPLRHGDRVTFCAADGGCSYAADRFAVTVQLIVLGGALLAVLLSLPETDPRRHAGRELPGGEYWFLLLSSVTGALLLPASRDLATLVIALEVTTLPTYALVGLRRNGDAGEAALKYFLSSVTATAIGLLGISFVYAGTGSLSFAAIADGLPAADPRLATLTEAGVALTLVGFLFKTAAVPFHFWVPETYLGAPLPVAAYLSVVAKTAGLAGLSVLTTRAFPAEGDLWGPLLAVLAGLTMTAGNAAAVRTDPAAPGGAVRLLAWSSVAQAGYLLVPLAAAAHGDPDAATGTLIAYALMYAAVNLGAFAVAAYIGRSRPAQRLADYRGLWTRRPLAALALAFFLLCLAGLPPGVAGLFAKVAVLRSAVDGGLGVLAVVTAVNVAAGLYYYLRWTAYLFRPEPDGAPDTGRPGAALTTAAGLAAAAALAFSGAPQLILGFTAASFL
ncbi:NADH-quinone oxidoreductase subunit N [Streptomyces sp. RFCAC02]|uniref:NADH-quinone oxidoreductase subunit N n=1 Tax=Streptomyces sp. RFCAC02 TaxID=2499143 RepID=UPI0010212E9D|nr:NADH-quinone oxidoreductase subunit N [Streptomyces sp. RFCAC02]